DPIVTRYSQARSDAAEGDAEPTLRSPSGSIAKPPASISYVVAANGSAGIGNRAESTEPTDHMTADRMQSDTPSVVAPPLGRTRIATPAKPTPTPASAAVGSLSCESRRRTTTQSGTDAIRSDASPVGTVSSA